MRNLVFGPLLGLSIIAASLGVTTPAHATRWRSFGTNLFLGIPNNNTRGQYLVLQNPNNLTSQTWSVAYDPAHPSPYGDLLPGYYKIVNGLRPNLPATQLVIGVAGNNMSDGTSLVDWTPTGEGNQAWLLYPAFTDTDGSMCYLFENFNPNPRLYLTVMAVANANRFVNARVVISEYVNDMVNRRDQFWCKVD